MKLLALFLLFATLAINVSSFYNSKRIKVREHVWVGDDISETYKTSVYVKNGSKLYDVMVEAAKEGEDFQFVSINETFHGIFITKIGENEQVPAENKYWLIYILDKSPNKNSPPGQADLSPLAVGNLVVEDKKHYLFWLRTANYTH